MLGYTTKDIEKMIDAIAIANDYLYDYREAEEKTAKTLNDAIMLLERLIAEGHVV